MPLTSNPHITRAGSAWARLQDGNLRWAQGHSEAAGSRGAARRAEVTTAQSPFALILGCSDSRVPAEILFDQGIGDLFVVRTAGHVVDAGVLGSVEYAVEILGVSLVIVLGHDGCGAVNAAAGIIDDAQVPPGYIRDVAERIAPNVLRARVAGATTCDEIAGQHARYTLELLRQRSTLLDDAVHRGTVSTQPAQYCLDTGIVTAVRQPTDMTEAAAHAAPPQVRALARA